MKKTIIFPFLLALAFLVPLTPARAQVDSIISPAVGANWPLGSQQTITWTTGSYLPSSTPLIIELLRYGTSDSDPVNNLVATWNSTNTGSLDVTLPSSVSFIPPSFTDFAVWIIIHTSDNSYAMPSSAFHLRPAPVTTYGLTVTTAGTGAGRVTSSPVGINCGTGVTDCSEVYNSGTSVTLTRLAFSGSTFTDWSGGGCSGSAVTCVVTMDADKTVRATFGTGDGGGGDKFVLNDRVVTNATVNVRDAAGGVVIDTKQSGAHGTVLGGPIVAGGYTWWQIDYDCGVTGWSAENLLDEDIGAPLDDCDGAGGGDDDDFGGGESLGWQEPTEEPPEGNTLPPVNVSIVTQDKMGALRVNGFRSYLKAFFDGEICLGETGNWDCRDTWPSGGAGGGISRLNQGLGITLTPTTITDTGTIALNTSILPGNRCDGSAKKLLLSDTGQFICADDLTGGGPGGWTPPTCSDGQVLKWNGGAWACGVDLTGGGLPIPPICAAGSQKLWWNGTFWECPLDQGPVSKIVAGSNITISPATGLGVVTINSTGAGGGSPGSDLVCSRSDNKLSWNGSAWSCTGIVVDGTEIADNTIDTVDLIDNSITNSKLDLSYTRYRVLASESSTKNLGVHTLCFLTRAGNDSTTPDDSVCVVYPSGVSDNGGTFTGTNQWYLKRGPDDRCEAICF